MRSSSATVALVLMLGTYGPIQAVAGEGASTGSLVGPLTAERSGDGMVISGTIEKFPAGTKIWVTIIHEPGGPTKPISGPEDDNVIIGSDGKFQARLHSGSDAAFRVGTYKIMLECHFNSGWQAVDILRQAGVELDSKGRSRHDRQAAQSDRP